MDWSLNEIEGLARKAARGAGYGWGHAEEAGKATRWLCAAGWPGAELLAGLLTAQDGVAHDAIRPRDCTGTWRANGGTLCPLVTGAVICDLAPRWAAGEALDTGPLAAPLFMVPYMVWCADQTGVPLALDWPGLHVSRRDAVTHIDLSDADAMTVVRVEGIRLGPAGKTRGAPLTRSYRAHVGTEASTTLDTLARRTYAPDTEASRLAGAGAGLSDND